MQLSILTSNHSSIQGFQDWQKKLYGIFFANRLLAIFFHFSYTVDIGFFYTGFFLTVFGAKI